MLFRYIVPFDVFIKLISTNSSAFEDLNWTGGKVRGLKYERVISKNLKNQFYGFNKRTKTGKRSVTSHLNITSVERLILKRNYLMIDTIG